MQSSHWPTSGRLQAVGYAPLSIVYRLLGDAPRAVAIAERGLKMIQVSRRDGGTADAGEQADVTREAARCLAAKSLALFSLDAEQGITTMRQALQMGGDRDAVVLALAKQLQDHLQQIGAAIHL